MGGRGRWISEIKASLVYRVSSRTARAIQRNLVLKNKKQKTENKTKQNPSAGSYLAQASLILDVYLRATLSF